MNPCKDCNTAQAWLSPVRYIKLLDGEIMITACDRHLKEFEQASGLKFAKYK